MPVILKLPNFELRFCVTILGWRYRKEDSGMGEGEGGHFRHEILQYITRNKEVWCTLSIAWCYKRSRCSNTNPLGFRIQLSPWLPAVHRPPSGPRMSFSWICLSSPVLSPFGGRKGFRNARGSRKSGKDEKNFSFSFREVAPIQQQHVANFHVWRSESDWEVKPQGWLAAKHTSDWQNPKSKQRDRGREGTRAEHNVA